MKLRLQAKRVEDTGQWYKYGRYYIEGFRQLPNVSLSIVPWPLRLFCLLIERGIKGASKASNVYFSIGRTNRSRDANFVSRYTLVLSSGPVKIALDTADGRAIVDSDAYAWSELYFKANCWRRFNYPDKVRPLVNGNGTLNEDKIDQLKQLRNQTKTTDLVFISRFYAGPRKKVHSALEHHTRLFETLSTLDCEKDLLAIIPQRFTRDLAASEQTMSGYLKRLDQAGVSWSYGWRGMPSLELWQRLAKAKVVFLRPGNHLCISWRMIDLLCMGACIICDNTPYPDWPVPLLPNQNYISCGCGLNPDWSLPDDACYRGMKDVIEGALSDSKLLQRIRDYNANYFDAHASPAKVAEYVLQTALQWVNANSASACASKAELAG